MTEHICPIATYREWRMDRKCEFELYPDSIRAAGRVPRGKFETTIALSKLDPSFDRLWIFSSLFYSGVFAFVGGLVALGIIVVGLNHQTLDSLTVPIGLFTLFGFGMAMFSGRKIELVLFRSAAGVPMLAIARAARRSDEFDAFVSAVVEGIVSARGAN
jgi:hypothetical protein